MTLTSEPSARFSELEQEELGSDIPVNRTAVVAFVLGIGSIIAMVHLALYLVPVAGFFLALLGLLQIRRAEGKQSGKSLAIIGLFCSVLFVSWSIAREVSRNRYIYGHAREYAEKWLELFQQQKFLEAHQLTMLEARRLERGGSLEKHYGRVRDPEAMKKKKDEPPPDPGAPSMDRMQEMMSMMEPTPKEELDSFFQRPVVQQMRNLGSTASYRYLAIGAIFNAGWANERIQLLYEANGQIDGKPKSFAIKLTLERNTQTGPGDWRVYEISDDTGK
jgi:hypothetical protein